MFTNPFKKLTPFYDEHSYFRNVGRSLALAALVGVVAGLGAVLFHLLSQLVAYLGLELIAGYHQGGPANEREFIRLFYVQVDHEVIPWLLLIVPTVGGLISGWLVYTFAPEAEGHGTDAAIDAYHNKRGLIRARVPIVKMFASAITLGTGGSGGREGPIAQIGAGFGSFLATHLHLKDHERRILLAAGIGGGIGAIFHAPLAGAIFAIEVLYRDPDFESEALVPAFIATTVGYCVFATTLGVLFGFETFGPLFSVAPGLTFNDPLLLLPLAGLALAMSLASFLYCRSFSMLTHFFRQLKIPPFCKPAIGGLLTGGLALIIFTSLGQFGFSSTAQNDSLSVLSYGYGFLQKILHPIDGQTLPVTLLLVVGLGKILTTQFTIGSGGSGGVFGPAMVIGGSLGAVVGIAFHQIMPETVTESDMVIFAILGMAAFFAATANTPVSTLIMVSELTGSYVLLMPAMWVCALAYVVSRRWTIYTKQVRNRMESPAHKGDFIIDILEGLTVQNALTASGRQFIALPAAMTLRDVVQMLTDNRQVVYPVLDPEGSYIGLFSLNDVRRFLYDSEMGDLTVAYDLAQDIPPLVLTSDLSEAIARFAQSNYEELPVAEIGEPDKIIGMLRRVDVIAAYNTQLLQTRSERA